MWNGLKFVIVNPKPGAGSRWTSYPTKAGTVSSLEADLKTALPRKLNFADPAKIVEMTESDGARRELAARQALDYNIRWAEEA